MLLKAIIFVINEGKVKNNELEALESPIVMETSN